MPANDFLPFGTGGGANVLTQVEYAALTPRTAGFVAGVAQSKQLNKVWRQGSLAAYLLGQVISDYSGQDALDDGDTTKLIRQLVQALRAQGYNAYTAGGTGNAILLTSDHSRPVLNPIPFGHPFLVLITAANTGPVTVTADGGTTYPLVHGDLADLQPNDLVVGTLVWIAFDGTRLQIVAEPRSAILNTKRSQLTADRGASTQTVPNNTFTRVTNYGTVNFSTNGGSTFSSGLLTIGAKDAGLWSISGHARQTFVYPGGFPIGFSNGLHINSATDPVVSDGAGESAPPAVTKTEHGSVSRTILLAAGDTVEMRLVQTTGGSVVFNDRYDFSAVRIGA